MIVGQIVGADRVIAHLEATTPKVMGSVQTAIQRLVLGLLRKVKNEKLNGQVLNVGKPPGGTLRRSINQRVVADALGVTGSVGTNISYARAHEYGFHGAVTVRAHLRMVKQAFGKALKNPGKHEVKALTRQMNLPERSFLRSAINEMAPEIQASIAQAVKAAL